jgi:hypothetical protein
MNVTRLLTCVALAMGFASIVTASGLPCATCPAVQAPYVQQVCMDDDEPPSWIFRRSTFTHDPQTGARVAQYKRLPSIEPLNDERFVTSRYHRTRTNLRGVDGSQETYYDVQSWGNGRGGIDAEWERFHDAWKESYLQNGYFNQNYGNAFPGQFGNGFGGPGFGNPGFGFPGGGNGVPFWWNQGAWWNQGPSWNGGQGLGNHGGDHHVDDHDHDHGGHGP